MTDPAATLDTLGRALPGALVVLDGAGRVAAWSPVAEAWFGVPASAAVGRNAAEAGIPGAEAWTAAARRVRAGGPPERLEPAALPGHVERWVEVNVSALDAPSGGAASPGTRSPGAPERVGDVLLFVRDATAEVRAGREAAARCAEPERRAAETEALRQVAVAAASSLDPDEIFASVCSQVRTLFRADLTAVDLPLMNARRHWCGEAGDPRAVFDALAPLLRTVVETGRTVVAARADGPAHGTGDEGRPAHALDADAGLACAMVVPLRADGEVPGALLVGWRGAADVGADTVRLAESLAAEVALAFRNARMYDSMLEAASRRDRFFSAMSHDLRTPITAIVGYSELLQDGIVGDLEARQLEMVERISQVAGHLSQLVNDILDLAKLDAGRMEFHLEEVPLGDLVEEAVVTVRPQAHGKSLALRLDIEGHRATRIHVDPPRVRQILVNLLSNAVKFTERGEVAVAVGMEDEQGWIEVRDTGPGLPSGSEEVVFEEFLQIASGNKAKREPGSGLGLAISRRLARAMGGDLTARSADGTGAVFTLYLPMRLD